MQVSRFQWQTGNIWASEGVLPNADLVLWFGSAASVEAGDIPAVLADRYSRALILGCSTAAGILGNQIVDDGGVGVACAFRDTSLRLVEADVASAEDSAAAGRQLGDSLQGDGLAGALVLTDGVHVNGSAITSTMAAILGPHVPVSGGLAADGACFVHTVVGVGPTARPGRAAAIGFYGGAVQLAHASAGGWTPFGPRRRITRSQGCVLMEIDGKPALGLYTMYLGEEAAGLPGTALLFPLLLWDLAAPSRTVTRTVLSIDPDAGTMTFAGDVPEGWGVQLMHGTFDRLVDGAACAGELARTAMPAIPGTDTLGLVISCVGRRLLLGQRTAEELRVVNEALGADVACVGFYSHGEIAPHAETGIPMLQNQTMAITLIAEHA